MNRNNPVWGKWSNEVYEEYSDATNKNYFPESHITNEKPKKLDYPCITYCVDPKTIHDNYKEVDYLELCKIKKRRYLKW